MRSHDPFASHYRHALAAARAGGRPQPCRSAAASQNRAFCAPKEKTRAVRRAGSPWQAQAGCGARLRTRCRWVDLGVARSLRRRRSSRRCARISSLAAAVDVDDVAEALATADGAMRSHHAAAAGELAGHMRAASRATRRRKALVQRQERRPLSSKQPQRGATVCLGVGGAVSDS